MAKLKVALDCDDVLFECCGYAIDIENKKNHTNMRLDERTSWGKTGTRTDCVFKYFTDPWFFQTQPIYDGAREFVKELTEMVDVYIMTAIDPKCMGIRANRIMEEFPEIDPSHIILGSPKELLHVDVLLDDAPHNITSSPATYPVLMRRPWNNEMSGLLSVESYDEFLAFIRTLLSQENETPEFTNNVYCFVGPSGSGKTAIIEALENVRIADEENSDVPRQQFAKVKTTTTRDKRDEESTKAYHFVSKKQFDWMKKENMFLETTVYGGEHYGTTQSAILDILNQGMDALLAIDIAGAISIKSHFGQAAKLIFVDRPKKETLKAILKRNISNEEKAVRILSLDSEDFNERFCDEVLCNNGTLEEAVDKFLDIAGKQSN